MPDHKQIYKQKADAYERLVSREDCQGNLLSALREVMTLEGIDVVETGAGTGRLTSLLAPVVRHITAYDISPAMLTVARRKLRQSWLRNWKTGTADHRSLPAPDACADLVISGWSLCYLVDWNRDNWQDEVQKGLAEMERVCRPGGTVVIIETQGTGFETPHPPDHLAAYFDFLGQQGYQFTWFRTDYQFENPEEARELTAFFFGEELAAQFSGSRLPECTGLWWKRMESHLLLNFA